MGFIDKYTRFILKVDTPKYWKVIRFILHWVTIPFKLALIGTLGLYQILKHKTDKPRSLDSLEVTEKTKQDFVEKTLNLMPVMHSQSLSLYVNRQPYSMPIDGTHHNPDHQLSRHATFCFIMGKLGLRTYEMDRALWMHMQGKYLARGYSWNSVEQTIEFNIGSTSGDMLCGLNLAMLDTDDDVLIERFDVLINHIIDNDYALLEGRRPGKEEPGQLLWDELLKANYGREEKINMKSVRGMWQPGLETVGAQALTILSALKVADKMGIQSAKKAYRKLLYKYGYGVLSLFPTAYVDSKRGYFNDHNCIISLYVLARLSTSRFEKFFWKLPMMYVWNLSKHWYNPYFTGLVREVYPELVSDEYLKKCQAYLYEEEPNCYSYYLATTIKGVAPVFHNELHEDEFSPDIKRDYRMASVNETTKIRTGLGFLASAVMLESDPRILLKK